MAEARRFVCGSCRFSVTAWSDGNPYYLDDKGKKQYAYHPNHELLELCIGNDEDHLCLNCGKEFRVDSQKPKPVCPTCKSDHIAPTFDLNEKPCPSCKAGTFEIDPDFFAVS